MTTRIHCNRGLLKAGLAAGLLAVGVFAGSVLTETHVHSQDVSAAEAGPKWEYNTVRVEAASLQGKLGELALDDWMVFSIVRYEQVLNTGNNDPRLRVTEYQVTARKRIAR